MVLVKMNAHLRNTQKTINIDFELHDRVRMGMRKQIWK